LKFCPLTWTITFLWPLFSDLFQAKVFSFIKFWSQHT
jgi:hypothetical protein